MLMSSTGSLLPASSLDSLAGTNPLGSGASYYPGTSMPLLGSWAAYGALYKYQLWVGIVIRKLAWGTARLPFDLKRQLDYNDQVPEPGSLAELLAQPNPRLSGFKLWLWTSATFDVYGEAMWLKLRDTNGRVRELHPLHPTNLVYRRDPETGEPFWQYTRGGSIAAAGTEIPVDDVVAFLSYNPDGLERGLSNLEGLRQTLLNEDAARRATSSWWARGARPSVALKHPGKLSTEAQGRLRATWEAQHAGADLMGGTAILEEGMEAQVIQLSAEEMQYIESRKLNREEVCAAYDVSPLVVHILDRATYSNVTEQLRSQYRDTMAPRLQFFEATIDAELVPDFYSTADRVFSRFNMDEVMRGSFEVRAAAGQQMIQSAIATPAEVRPMFGLPKSDDPAANLLYGNAALVPLGSSVHGAQEVDVNGDLIPTPLPAPTPTPALPPAKRHRFDTRGLARRLGRVKAAGGDHHAALVAEHEAALVDLFGRQVDAATSTAGVDLATYNDELAATLLALGAVTSKTAGDRIAKKLGGAWDTDRLADWLQSNAADSAAAINVATAQYLGDTLLGGPGVDLEAYNASVDQARVGLAARASTIAVSRVAVVGGLAEQSAAEQAGAAQKIWVAGPNPRDSHAELDGEAVPLGELFSNGMNGPGDPAGGADEVAGCNCSLDFEMP